MCLCCYFYLFIFSMFLLMQMPSQICSYCYSVAAYVQQRPDVHECAQGPVSLSRITEFAG